MRRSGPSTPDGVATTRDPVPSGVFRPVALNTLLVEIAICPASPPRSPRSQVMLRTLAAHTFTGGTVPLETASSGPSPFRPLPSLGTAGLPPFRNRLPVRPRVCPPSVLRSSFPGFFHCPGSNVSAHHPSDPAAGHEGVVPHFVRLFV